MTCSETREFMFAFLDNEVDAPVSMDLQRHLDTCPQCAREVEVERAIRRQLTLRLESDHDIGACNEHALRTAISQVTSRRHKFLHSRRAVVLAGAAAAVIGIGVGLWNTVKTVDNELTSRQISELAVSDFEHFLEEGGVLQVESSDRDVVETWLYEKTALAVVLPVPVAPGWKLAGGRKCKFHGQPAAFAVFEVNGVPASLVAVSADLVSADSWNQAIRSGKSYMLDYCRGHTIVSYRHGGLLYSAVSTLPHEELSTLVMGMPNESN